ncbi:hypothetical protein ACIODW_02925 [Streptomyces sp. NPDC087897]|uniref:hypothetical protein n=1 Tax=Streptomyces sp. NPDC087897 TaxID=3365817 RepID=UPI00382731D5
MTRTDTDAAAVWSRSLSALFGEGMFAAVGARRRDDWRLDALDVMRLTTGDPRGWSRRISAAGGSAHGLGADGPFGAVVRATFDGAYPVSRRSAEQIVVTLHGAWFQTDDIPDFSVREPGLTAHAGVLPGRFGADAVLFTNAVTARTDPHADMFHRDGVYEGFTGHAMDCGVIAVSATEVGVFWAFSTD